MNKEERILKYINSADELVFNGKRYYENDFYNDVENLVKENQELKKQIEEYQKALDDTMSEKMDLEEENQKYKEIINELEKWLNTQTIISLKYEIGYYKKVLDKLKELKENKQ